MCGTHELILSDYNILWRVSGNYTHVSEAHNTMSWLDHNMNVLLQDIEILEKIPCSDHLPLCAFFNLDLAVHVALPSADGRGAVSFHWANASDEDIALYSRISSVELGFVTIPDGAR